MSSARCCGRTQAAGSEQVDGQDDLDVLRAEPTVDVDANAAEAIVADVMAKDRQRKWAAPALLTLGSTSWRPSAVGNGQNVLHVALLDTLPSFLVRRFVAAHAAGFRLHVALTTAALYQPAWLRLLSEVDAHVYVVDDFDKAARYRRRHVLAAVADLQVPVSPTDRAAIGKIALDRIDAGTAQEKGRRLEALLAFLFSQVSDFRVVLRNHRNKSQEIDLTLQIDNFSRRVWHGKPLILVEAKNRSTKADQPTFSVLVTKIRTKRQSVKIGILVSTTGFTADLERESLRYSESDLCVVLIGPAELRALFESEDLDDHLERMVIKALMD